MSMSERFDKLFERMKLEFKKQTMELTYSLTRNLSVKLEEKIKPLKQENQALKLEIEFLEKKISYLERDNKRNNIIIFGFEEKETCVKELLEAVRKKMVNDLKTSVMSFDINNVYRVGKRKDDTTKPRPVVVTFSQTWKRNEVLRNKKKFRNIFVSEDFPKDVLEKRKVWLEELKEERKKGNIAYLVYDKLLVKPGRQDNVKKEEIEKEEDFSELLEGLDQEEQEKKPRRRAKAMINRDQYKMVSDEEKPQSRTKTNTNKENVFPNDEKPRRRAKATINKNNNFMDTESEDDKATGRSRRKSKAKPSNNVRFSDGESEEDDKPKPRARISIGKNNNRRKESDEEHVDEKSYNDGTASTSKNENFTEYIPHKRKIDY